MHNEALMCQSPVLGLAGCGLADLTGLGHWELVRGHALIAAPTAIKRAKTVTQQNAKSAAWDQHNERPDETIWRNEILPHLTDITLIQMMRATGLSSGCCSMIR